MLEYAPPSLSQFTAERCSDDGATAETDGVHVRITATASASPVGGKNTMACAAYYRLTSAESWGEATTLMLLSPTFDTLSSYDIKFRVQAVWLGET